MRWAQAEAGYIPPRFLILGDPQNRRVSFFQEALQRAGLPPGEVLSYRELLVSPEALAKHLRPGLLVRIESPGEDFEVEKGLLALGAEVEDMPGPARISRQAALKLAPDFGRILYPRQCYLGFRALLGRIEEALSNHQSIALNAPRDIAVMFDKPACQARFLAGALPTPSNLGKIRSYEELLAAMRAAGWEAAFVKLSHGSSASGVVAYRRGARASAVTSVARVREGGETKLYNSLNIRRYQDHSEIEEILDILCAEGVIVEEWLPKARLGGKPFDLRVVVIAGEARHFVVRTGRSPMTNLHLGNARGDAGALLAKLSPASWEEAQRTCARAARLFPQSLYAGVDLLLLPGKERHALLEINAFGDLLPGVHDARGLGTYAAELQAVLDPALTRSLRERPLPRKRRRGRSSAQSASPEK